MSPSNAINSVTAVNMARLPSISQVSGGFRVTWAQSSAEARTVVLGTGVSDIEPNVPHLAEALRDGALRYCPVCDAFEVTGQRVGCWSAALPASTKRSVFGVTPTG